MLGIGNRIQGAELFGLTRSSARLARKGKVINLTWIRHEPTDSGLTLGTELIAIKTNAVKSDL